jgi:hypothetical protein
MILEVTAKYRQQIYRKNTQRVPDSMAILQTEGNLDNCITSINIINFFVFIFPNKPILKLAVISFASTAL